MPKIITLTTDFGTADGYVGAMKGRILAIAPKAQVVDITHEIESQSVYQAAFCVERSVVRFPKGCIHVVVVDPGVGSERHPLAIKTSLGWLIGPDNGVFTRILDQYPPQKIIQISKNTLLWEAHQSFDGLALFAPVAAHLSKGLSDAEIGNQTESYFRLSFPTPFETSNSTKGEILVFDRFGNAITNINRDTLRRYKNPQIRLVNFPDTLISLRTHYLAQGKEHPLAIVNSDGLLEIAMSEGSAQEKFNLVKGDGVTIEEESLEED